MDTGNMTRQELEHLCELQARKLAEKDSALKQAEYNLNEKMKIIESLSNQLGDRKIRCGRL